METIHHSMHAIEFETNLQHGVLMLPEAYKSIKDQRVRVVVLLDERGNDPGVQALSDHSASLIDEWHDPSEDEVWR